MLNVQRYPEDSDDGSTLRRIAYEKDSYTRRQSSISLFIYIVDEELLEYFELIEIIFSSVILLFVNIDMSFLLCFLWPSSYFHDIEYLMRF